MIVIFSAVYSVMFTNLMEFLPRQGQYVRAISQKVRDINDKVITDEGK